MMRLLMQFRYEVKTGISEPSIKDANVVHLVVTNDQMFYTKTKKVQIMLTNGWEQKQGYWRIQQNSENKTKQKKSQNTQESMKTHMKLFCSLAHCLLCTFCLWRDPETNLSAFEVTDFVTCWKSSFSCLAGVGTHSFNPLKPEWLNSCQKIQMFIKQKFY